MSLQFRHGATCAFLAVLSSASLPSIAFAQWQFPHGEYGDAPGGALAYPGVPGLFPTCRSGPSGFIFHAVVAMANDAFFGPAVDFEDDGNANLCPQPPYDVDECYGPLDVDAGLTIPSAYTYGPTMQLITCSGVPARPLQQTCGTVRWGTDLDIRITNNFGVPAYFNVLMDLDHSGDWAVYPVGPVCGAQVPEHVIRNLPVPVGFTGLASQLPIAGFQVGPDSGLVWARFTLTEQPVLFPWNGAGMYEGGETEDYLLRVVTAFAAEYGDAPQGAKAYPPTLTVGQFPTCVAAGAFVRHLGHGQLFMGGDVDYEGDGNAGTCAFPDYDRDECFGTPDAGLTAPRSYTIDATQNIVACAPTGTALGIACQLIAWGTDCDVRITNNLPADAYFNLLVDWDQDGRWAGIYPGCLIGAVISEHVIQNLTVPAGFSGLLSQLNPSPAHLGGRGFTWARFTVSDSPVAGNWDGSGQFPEGETEDYLLRIDPAPTDVGERGPAAFRVGACMPNPMLRSTAVEFELPHNSSVGLGVFDTAGRRVRDLGSAWRPAGTHHVDWDGRGDAGKELPAGVYFVRLRSNGETVSRRVLLLR